MNPGKQVGSSCAVFTLTHFSRHAVLHGGGAGDPELLVKSGAGYCCRRGVAEKATRGVQRADGSDEKTVNERGSDRTHRSCENNGTVGVKTASRGHESREARSVRTWQRLRRLGLSLDREELRKSQHHGFTIANRNQSLQHLRAAGERNASAVRSKEHVVIPLSQPSGRLWQARSCKARQVQQEFTVFHCNVM